MKKYQLGNITVSSLRKVFVYDEECRCYREKHTIKVSNGKINKYFTYTTETLKFIDRENLFKNALYCIYQDYLSIEYQNNEEDFINEFGYEDEEGKKIYRACLKGHDRFCQVVDSDTLEMMQEVFNQY